MDPSPLRSLRKIVRAFRVRKRLENIRHVGEMHEVATQVRPGPAIPILLLGGFDKGRKAHPSQPKFSHNKTLVLR